MTSLLLLRALPLLYAIADGGATVTGTVRNSDTGLPVAGLAVVMTDTPHRTLTDSTGRYVLADVPAGAHHVLVRGLGFAARTLHAIVPSWGILEINVALTPVTTRLTTLVVRSQIRSKAWRALDSTTGGSADRRRSSAAIHDNPLRIEPDVVQALSGGDVHTTPEMPSGVHVRGGATDHVAYSINGIPVFNPYHSAGISSGWNPDAIASAQLFASVPSAGDANALSGSLNATTRSAGERWQALGAVSTTHARVTVDGPTGVRDMTLLLSARAGFPAAAAPLREDSYVRGGTGDRLATIASHALGGQLRITGYDSEDELNTANAVDTVSHSGNRNAFSWGSRSLGVEFVRFVGEAQLRTVAWHASTRASADWLATAGPLAMSTARADDGLLFSARRQVVHAVVTTGFRVERSQTHYQVDFANATASPFARRATNVVPTAFVEHEAALGARWNLQSAASVSMLRGRMYANPRAQLRWELTPHVTITGSSARLHQFAQSLRNAETVTGSIFPADLFVGAGAAGVPVAVSNQHVVAVAYRPSSRVRVSGNAYHRRFDGVVLSALADGDPFATQSVSAGRGASRGASVDASLSVARVAVEASYGWQRTVYESATARYTPNVGAGQQLNVGVTMSPTRTMAIRLGFVGEANRSATTVSNFEWESCNLRDRGCEFSGSPRTSGETLGGTRLPAYARVDLGVRKQWHRYVGGRDATVALYGAATNLLARQNVLTYARDVTTRALTPIDMRPFAPLVIGMEWHY